MRRVAAVSIALGIVLLAGCSTAPSGPAPGSGVQREVPSGVPVIEAGSGSPTPEPAQAEESARRFEGGVYRIGPWLRATLIGRNWKPGCRCRSTISGSFAASYWNFDGEVRPGPSC